jgi:hypothetical protein
MKSIIIAIETDQEDIFKIDSIEQSCGKEEYDLILYKKPKYFIKKATTLLKKRIYDSNMYIKSDITTIKDFNRTDHNFIAFKIAQEDFIRCGYCFGIDLDVDILKVTTFDFVDGKYITDNAFFNLDNIETIWYSIREY